MRVDFVHTVYLQWIFMFSLLAASGIRLGQ